MATNDFKPFATGAGANVMSQADYLALAALITGFQSGKASSAQVNKALRQATFIASALAQFVSDKSGADVLDDGDINAFVTKLTNGFGKQYLSRNSPFADIKADNTGATARSNLDLKTAAQRDVGTGTGQIPDMSSFTSSLSASGWQKLPSGLIIQWGQVLSNSGGFAPWTFPIAFPSQCFQVLTATFVGASAQDFTATMIGNPSLTAVTAACYVSGVQSSITGQVGVRYLAIGY
ncbi:gp53-like domain-containing protein [Atlantibacter sp.]|uniref:gp53-like domain-containing protein n=1 Tax=Atlantibacter sp. TaxID=1903473 RepID=UPI0028A91FEF|nr:hypothetical protein [Atlantibacter sp.]